MALSAKALNPGDEHSEVVADNPAARSWLCIRAHPATTTPCTPTSPTQRKLRAIKRLCARHADMGLTGKMLTNYVGDARLTKFGVRFTNQVWPGDTLTATAVVTEIAKKATTSSLTWTSRRRTRTARPSLAVMPRLRSTIN